MGTRLFTTTGFSGGLSGEVSAQRAQAAAAEARGQVESLRQDVERLMMICEALWSVLKEQHGYTDDELTRRIEEVDLRDGQLDGRVARQPAALCPQCNRTLMRGRSVCLYCGASVVVPPFER